MAPKQKEGGLTVEQGVFVVPDLSIKELLDAIPCARFYTPSLGCTEIFVEQGTLLQALCAPVVRLHVEILRRGYSIIELTQLLHRAWDLFVIGCIYKTASYVDKFIDPSVIELPHPYAYRLARFALWSLYGFWAGLFATGLWVIGHECGHQAFSESKFINNTVGWIIHSG
jgi:omega-6 fatty acid desaturase (delta-12 desaturase)